MIKHIERALLVGLASGAVLGLLFLAAADTLLPEKMPPKVDLPPLRLEFETDERHFTVMAWLHWVGDRAPEETALQHFAEEAELKEHLASQKLPAEMHKKHRAAYEAFLPGSSLDLKNCLLFGASIAYGPPPSFASKPFASLEPAEQARSSLLNDWLVSLPPAALMAEFHEKAKLHELWETRMKQSHSQALEHYRPRAEKFLQEAYTFLKVPIDVPVSLRVNLLGNFGLLGHTIYSPWERRYIINLHFNSPQPGASVQEVDDMEAEHLRIMRHELSHALLNDTVIQHQQLLAPKLARMAKELDLEWLKVSDVEFGAREWIADCIGNCDLEAFMHENVVYYHRNPLYAHFMERLPAYRGSGKSFSEFIPEFFASFDAEVEITRWKALLAKQKAVGE